LPELIAGGMLGFKVSPASAILTFVLFAGVIGMENAYGQSEAPYANCIQMIFQGDVVQLVTDDDCSDGQFSQAVAYYKANGYPVESTYMDMVTTKLIELKSTEYAEATK
jgi:hypothetical protein